MIGLKRGTVKLSSDHIRWEKLFEKEKQLLTATLDNTIDIEHVGSTAIPNVPAKPIIDIMIGFSKMRQAKEIYKILSEMGYKDRGEQGVFERRLFVKGAEDNRTHYLHVTKKNSGFWIEHILFRDYLRQHKDARDEYGELKKQLEKEYSDNRKQYTKEKADYIQKIIIRAKKLL